MGFGAGQKSASRRGHALKYCGTGSGTLNATATGRGQKACW